jgi:hypothetical protein
VFPLILVEDVPELDAVDEVFPLILVDEVPELVEDEVFPPVVLLSFVSKFSFLLSEYGAGVIVVDVFVGVGEGVEVAFDALSGILILLSNFMKSHADETSIAKSARPNVIFKLGEPLAGK